MKLLVYQRIALKNSFVIYYCKCFIYLLGFYSYVSTDLKKKSLRQMKLQVKAV